MVALGLQHMDTHTHTHSYQASLHWKATLHLVLAWLVGATAERQGHRRRSLSDAVVTHMPEDGENADNFSTSTQDLRFKGVGVGKHRIKGMHM
eukprot:scaffold243947_cov18-Tisochrysis_lutea.AAC.1